MEQVKPDKSHGLFSYFGRCRADWRARFYLNTNTETRGQETTTRAAHKSHPPISLIRSTSCWFAVFFPSSILVSFKSCRQPRKYTGNWTFHWNWTACTSGLHFQSLFPQKVSMQYLRSENEVAEPNVCYQTVFLLPDTGHVWICWTFRTQNSVWSRLWTNGTLAVIWMLIDGGRKRKKIKISFYHHHLNTH